jgi:hypothetical protein
MGEFLKGYKGFEKGLVCRGKQYKEDTVFEEEKAEICRNGMHFCVNPFDVLEFYNLVNNDGSFNDFAEVEAQAESKTDDNKKFCTTKLKVGAKLSFAGFVKACVDFVLEKTTVEIPDKKVNDNDEALISSKIKNAKIGSSGGSAQIGSSGYSAKIGSSGYYAQIGSSGYSAKIGSSGDYAQIGSSGGSAQIGSSGGSAKIGSSGGSAQIGSSGGSAKIGSSGDYAKIDSSGEDSVICCAGHNSVVKAKKGSWITLAEWVRSEEKNRFIPKCVKTEFVDGERIKEDTFYKLVNGEFEEV